MTLNEVTLDRVWLINNTNNAEIRRILPPLQLLHQKMQKASAGGCKCARKKKRNLQDSDFQQAQRQLHNYLASHPAAIAALKQTLSANSLRIKFPKADRSGMVVKKFQ